MIPFYLVKLPLLMHWAILPNKTGSFTIGVKKSHPCGMSVTGQVNPNCIWKNKGAQVGDVLILTKRIGTGIMNNALKADLFPVGTEQAVTSMSTLNRVGAEVGHNLLCMLVLM